MTNKSIPEISVDTRLLLQVIREMKPDQMIEYPALSAVIGRDVTNGARSNLSSATRMAQRDHNMVIFAVRGVGIKRLTDSAVIATVGEHGRKRLGWLAARTAKKIMTPDPANLTSSEKIRQNAELSQLGALRAFAGDKVTKRIESKVTDAAHSQLAIAKTLEAFEK